MSISLKNNIETLTESVFPNAVAHYRHLHRHPELSFAESETSAYICTTLQQFGIPYDTGFGGTGVLGIVHGRTEAGPVVVLRADMDALPIQENSGLPYASQTPGVMHACGHDIHTATLLGVAEVLNGLKNDFNGTILLLFQPAEEKFPGGANTMLQHGVFDHWQPDIIIGNHVLPGLDVGHIAMRPGVCMASADELFFTVTGKGGHAALPQMFVDPVLATSQIIVALQQVVSRNANPATPSVLSFGRFMANGATNVIPDKVEVAGTFRTLDDPWRDEAHKLIERIINHTAEAYGCRADITIHRGYPSVLNHVAYTTMAGEFAGELLGIDHVHPLDVRMTAEDFAYFSRKYPAVFYRVGIVGQSNPNCSGLHTATFKVDEETLKTSVSAMSYMALRFIEHFNTK